MDDMVIVEGRCGEVDIVEIDTVREEARVGAVVLMVIVDERSEQGVA